MRKSIPFVTAFAVATSISPASALGHAAVTSRTPAPGASISNVRSVKIAFDESVITGKIALYKGAHKVGTGGLVNKNRGLSLNFSKPLAKGGYTVKWSVRSDDGHHEASQWSFRMA